MMLGPKDSEIDIFDDILSRPRGQGYTYRRIIFDDIMILRDVMTGVPQDNKVLRIYIWWMQMMGLGF